MIPSLSGSDRFANEVKLSQAILQGRASKLRLFHHSITHSVTLQYAYLDVMEEGLNIFQFK